MVSYQFSSIFGVDLHYTESAYRIVAVDCFDIADVLKTRSAQWISISRRSICCSRRPKMGNDSSSGTRIRRKRFDEVCLKEIIGMYGGVMLMPE
jgi:hypothetical protein